MPTISQLNIGGVDYEIKDAKTRLSLTSLENRVESLENNSTTVMDSVINTNSGNANLVWKTDNAGVPGWRTDANTTYENSSASAAGLMTSAQFNKLNNIGAIKSVDGGWKTLQYNTWGLLASTTLSKGTYIILVSTAFGYLESGDEDGLLGPAINDLTNATNNVVSSGVSKMPTFTQKTRVLTKRAGGGIAAIQIQIDGEGANKLSRSASSGFQIGWGYNKDNYHVQTIRFLPLSENKNIYIRGYQNYAKSNAGVTAAAYFQALRIA